MAAGASCPNRMPFFDQILSTATETAARSLWRGSFAPGPYCAQNAVELDDGRGNLLQLAALRLVGAVRRGNEQAKDQGGHGCDEPHDEFNHILGVFAHMIDRQLFAQDHAENCRREGAEKIIDETANGANNSGISDP